MSIELRQTQVIECDESWNTLVGLSDQEIKQFVESNIHPANWWGEKQEQAAKIAVNKMGIESAAFLIDINPEAEISYACAVKRPPLLFEDNRLAHYSNWRDVNSKSPEQIAEEWIKELRKKGNRYLEAISSHIRCEDLSDRFFITSFNVGTVHRADGSGGDKFDLFAANEHLTNG
jgi:hypothetical protein